MKRLKRLLWIPLLFLCSTLWAADFGNVGTYTIVDKDTIIDPVAQEPCNLQYTNGEWSDSLVAKKCEEPVQLARMNPYILGAQASAAAACSSCSGAGTIFAQATGSDNTLRLKYDSNEGSIGQQAFTVAENTCLCRADVYFSVKSGDPSGYNYTVEVWSVNGTALDSMLCQSASKAGSFTQNAWETNFLLSCSLATGTTYAVILNSDTTNGSNYWTVYVTTDGAMTGSAAQWKADKSRSYDGDGLYEASFKLYKP